MGLEFFDQLDQNDTSTFSFFTTLAHPIMSLISIFNYQLAREKSITIFSWLMGIACFSPVLAQVPSTPKTVVADLRQETKLELVPIPPGEFMMGSSPEEKAWATGIEGGAQAGTERESYEGEIPRKMKVPHTRPSRRSIISVNEAVTALGSPICVAMSGKLFSITLIPRVATNNFTPPRKIIVPSAKLVTTSMFPATHAVQFV